MSIIVNFVLLAMLIVFPAVVGAMMGILYGGANQALMGALIGGSIQFGLLYIIGRIWDR